MNLIQYQQAAARTMNDDHTVPMQMVVYGLGFAGEAIELMAVLDDPYLDPADIRKEAGDVSWYSAAISNKLGWNLAEVIQDAIFTEKEQMRLIRFSNLDLALMTTIEAGKAGELIKKIYGHGHGFEEREEQLKQHVGKSMRYLILLLSQFKMDLGEVFDTNIEKLKTRYPDKFSTEASIARVDA